MKELVEFLEQYNYIRLLLFLSWTLGILDLLPPKVFLGGGQIRMTTNPAMESLKGLCMTGPINFWLLLIFTRGCLCDIQIIHEGTLTNVGQTLIQLLYNFTKVSNLGRTFAL